MKLLNFAQKKNRHHLMAVLFAEIYGIHIKPLPVEHTKTSETQQTYS
jgi:hypothetical protein